MKIYYVNTRPEDAEKSGITRLLLSYGLMRTMMSNWRRFLDTGRYEIFLDCGAFQVHSIKATVTLEEYVNFIRQWRMEFYANLDVIGDAEATYRNQKKMEEYGLRPIPVFHIGEDFRYLKAYLESYDYVALGGIVKRGSRAYNKNFMARCFWEIREFWPKRIHGFGVTDLDSLETFPFYSVDSSSAVVSAAFGRIIQFKDKALTYGRQQHYETGSKYFHLVDTGQEKSKGRAKTVHNLTEYMKVEQYITRLWEERGITWAA